MYKKKKKVEDRLPSRIILILRASVNVLNNFVTAVGTWKISSLYISLYNNKIVPH